MLPTFVSIVLGIQAREEKGETEREEGREWGRGRKSEKKRGGRDKLGKEEIVFSHVKTILKF